MVKVNYKGWRASDKARKLGAPDANVTLFFDDIACADAWMKHMKRAGHKTRHLHVVEADE